MTLTAAISQVVLRIVPNTEPIDVVLESAPLPENVVDGLLAAHEPSATNPFATIADLPSAFPLAVPVLSDWTNPDNCLADIQTALGWSFQPGGGTQHALISLTRLTVGQSSSAALLVSMAGVIPIASYKVSWQAGVPEITFPPEEILLTAISNFDPALQSELTSHKSDATAHAAINSRFDAAGTATTAVNNHASALDPHNDRGYANGAIDNHNSDDMAHEAINARFDASGSAASAVNGHVSATDPHNDRAFASGLSVNYDAAGAAVAAVSAHNALLAAHGRLPLSRYTWAWNNQVGSTVSENGGSVLIGAAASGASATYAMRAREVSFNGAGSFTVYGLVKGFASTVFEHGIMVRSGSIVYDLYKDSTTIRCGSRTSVDAATRTIIASLTQLANVMSDIWLMIRRTGSDIEFLYSYDAANWIVLTSTSDSSAMTYCGIFGENRAASGTLYVSCTDFSITPSPV